MKKDWDSDDLPVARKQGFEPCNISADPGATYVLTPQDCSGRSALGASQNVRNRYCVPGFPEIAYDAVTRVVTVPLDVFLVIYASERTYCREMQQVYCFELRIECPDYQRRWAEELEASSVQQLLQQALSLQ